MFQPFFGITLIVIGLMYVAYGVMEIIKPHSHPQEVAPKTIEVVEGDATSHE